MKDELCSFELYLRTGIFQVEKYNAVISVSGIEFTPSGVLKQGTPFCILNSDIKSVFLYIANVVELEIFTENQQLIGNIKPNVCDVKKLVELMQRLYHKKFTFQYELI